MNLITNSSHRKHKPNDHMCVVFLSHKQSCCTFRIIYMFVCVYTCIMFLFAKLNRFIQLFRLFSSADNNVDRHPCLVRFSSIHKIVRRQRDPCQLCVTFNDIISMVIIVERVNIRSVLFFSLFLLHLVYLTFLETSFR
jgi:hypothetical protein